MPIIRKVPKQKTKVQAKPKAVQKPKAVHGGINALLKKLQFANTPKERAIYLERLKTIQDQLKKSGKKAA